MKVFFSYASEDKKIVEQIFLRFSQKFPDITGWLDKYEILGGDDLIDKIGSGIENADKFLIFLSPSSIDKPWVKRELKKALYSEIEGIKPEFIIPIKLEKISRVPVFMEGRFYIDIGNKTEVEWLDELYNSVTRQKKSLDSTSENLSITFGKIIDNSNAIGIWFDSKFWREDISFQIRTSQDIKSTRWVMPWLAKPYQATITEFKGDREYKIRIHNYFISPQEPFSLGIEFFSSTGCEPQKNILEILKWDGQGGTSSLGFYS